MRVLQNTGPSFVQMVICYYFATPIKNRGTLFACGILIFLNEYSLLQFPYPTSDCESQLL